MTIDYVMVGAAGVGIATVVMIAAEVRRLLLYSRAAGCARKVAASPCPRCQQLLTDSIFNDATQTRQRFTGARGRLRGRDYPSRLLRVVCPRCGAELHFRLDATLFSCDHVVSAEQDATANAG